MFRYNQESLLETIENLRREMVSTGIEEGISSQRTIKLSQQLDAYIANYQSKLLKRETDMDSIHEEINLSKI